MGPFGRIADKGHVVRGMIALHGKPPDGALSEAAKEANRSVNGKVILGCLRGAGGAPVATRGEVVSTSATKAPHGGIGRE